MIWMRSHKHLSIHRQTVTKYWTFVILKHSQQNHTGHCPNSRRNALPPAPLSRTWINELRAKSKSCVYVTCWEKNHELSSTKGLSITCLRQWPWSSLSPSLLFWFAKCGSESPSDLGLRGLPFWPQFLQVSTHTIVWQRVRQNCTTFLVT